MRYNFVGVPNYVSANCCLVCLAILQENRKVGNVKLGKTASGFVVVPNCCPALWLSPTAVRLCGCPQLLSGFVVVPNCCPALWLSPTAVQLLFPSALATPCSMASAASPLRPGARYARILAYGLPCPTLGRHPGAGPSLGGDIHDRRYLSVNHLN